MKSIVSLVIISLMSFANVKAQVYKVSPLVDEPMMLLDTIRVNVKSLFVDMSNIESVNVMKDSASTAPYGTEGAKGVVLIQTRETRKYYRMPEFLDHFSIGSADQQLPVCIDNMLLSQSARNTFLAELGMVELVEISNGCEDPANNSFHEGKVIAIKTKGKNFMHANETTINQSPIAERYLRHVVLFKFKDGTTQADIQKVADAFRKLPAQIKEIADFEWGINNSPENLNQGFTHCFFVSFKNEKDREIYLPHPAHKEFVAVLQPHLDKVLVVDYWSGK